MSAQRLYLVTDATGTERLVRAGHPSTAVQHVSKGQFKAVVATTEDVYRLAQKGVKAEDVGSEQAVLPTT